MYTKIRYNNESIGNVDIDFDLAPSSSGYIAIQTLTHELVPRTTSRGKSEANGSWPVFTYYESMLITLEGEVLAGSVVEFNAYIVDIMQKCMVDPEIQQTERQQGQFIIRLDGFGEDWAVPVSVEIPPQIPISAPSFARAPFHMSFRAYRPYYYGAVTNRYYWHP